MKSGFVLIVGRPNVGKSTLLNNLLKQKISIVTPKAQTTRRKIVGIMHLPDAQIAFVDTPGVLENPAYLLHKRMLESVEKAIKDDADVIVYMVELHKNTDLPPELEEKIKEKPHVVAINKIDEVKGEGTVILRKEEMGRRFPSAKIIPISAIRGDGLNELIEAVKDLLPEGEPYYEEGTVTTMSSSFYAAEIVREKIFLFTRQEIPYDSAVSVERYEEKGGSVYIDASIIVSRPSQKGIIIGKDGSMLTRIGKAAREELEKLLGRKVVLKLRVKVHKGWKDNPRLLRKYNY